MILCIDCTVIPNWYRNVDKYILREDTGERE